MTIGKGKLFGFGCKRRGSGDSPRDIAAVADLSVVAQLGISQDRPTLAVKRARPALRSARQLMPRGLIDLRHR